MKIKREGIQNLIKWLENNPQTSFYKSPCSKDHHLNYEGGLAIHSWNVYELFKEKNQRYKLGLSEESVIICGLLHDICKVNFYKQVKTYKDGCSEPEYGYEYDDKFPIGHGEKSVIIIEKFITLTDEEACIIRWHMAGFDISPYGKPAYYKAIEMYPACLALHTADYEATTFLEQKTGA